MAGNRGELYQVMRIVGEKEVRTVARGTCPVPDGAQPVKKILDVITDIQNDKDWLSTNKAIKEGVLHTQIIYVACNDFIRYASMEIPFMAQADIPGVLPSMHMQNRIIRVEKEVLVESEPSDESSTFETFKIKAEVKTIFQVMENVARKPRARRHQQGQNFSMPSGRSGAVPRHRHLG